MSGHPFGQLPSDHPLSPNELGAWTDQDYAAYTIGAAADMLGVTTAFLRQLGTAGLLEPQRSDGGHRRYSGHQLQLASYARTLVDEGLTLDAACRIVALEVQLAAAHEEIARLRARIDHRG
ncbi:MAG: MerR family transcriptional regulator [Actinocatenispora sp.]